jgi:ATP-dependent Clp protease ATP-binding subunit ClpC
MVEYNDRAQQALTMAERIAGANDSELVGTEHLLYALVVQEHSAAIDILEKLEVSIGDLRETLRGLVGENMGDREVSSSTSLSDPVSAVLGIVNVEAEEALSEYVYTADLLEGLIREGGRAAGILADVGIDLAALRREQAAWSPLFGSTGLSERALARRDVANGSTTGAELKTMLLDVRAQKRLAIDTGNLEEASRMRNIEKEVLVRIYSYLG